MGVAALEYNAHSVEMLDDPAVEIGSHAPGHLPGGSGRSSASDHSQVPLGVPADPATPAEFSLHLWD